mgnify:CR=1 FL=1
MRALLLCACVVVALPGLERIPDAAVAIAVADSAGDDPGAERIGACAAVLRVAEDRAEVVTLPEALPEGRDRATAVLPGGKRRPLTVLRRGALAVLAAIDLRPGDRLEALTCADSRALAVGDASWTVGNAFGAIEIDGRPAASRGVVSGRYEIPADAPDVRGRRGAVLSRHRGEVFETDAAVNDGDQGGPVLDDDGRLIGEETDDPHVVCRETSRLVHHIKHPKRCGVHTQRHGQERRQVRPTEIAFHLFGEAVVQARLTHPHRHPGE